MNDLQTCSRVKAIFTRRDVLQTTACGFGWLAFSALAGTQSLLAAQTADNGSPLAPKKTPLKQRAKRVIFLCMSGAPSHVDLLDYKPQLNRDSGKPGPRPGSQWLGSKWKFSQHGNSGLWMSELLPYLSKHADRMCVVSSMQTDQPAHPQAYIKLHTGTAQFVRPSLGAWTLYGLGTENQNLPGFVSLTPPSGIGGATNYGSSFLPAVYQGTRVGQSDRPIRYASVANLTTKRTDVDQRKELDFIQSLNREKLNRDSFNPAVDGVIQSYGYEAVENPVQIADLHATMLAMLGQDHKSLTYRHAGRDFRLTDVKGNVISDIMA